MGLSSVIRSVDRFIVVSYEVARTVCYLVDNVRTGGKVTKQTHTTSNFNFTNITYIFYVRGHIQRLIVASGLVLQKVTSRGRPIKQHQNCRQIQPVEIFFLKRNVACKTPLQVKTPLPPWTSEFML